MTAIKYYTTVRPGEELDVLNQVGSCLPKHLLSLFLDTQTRWGLNVYLSLADFTCCSRPVDCHSCVVRQGTRLYVSELNFHLSFIFPPSSLSSHVLIPCSCSSTLLFHCIPSLFRLPQKLSQLSSRQSPPSEQQSSPNPSSDDTSTSCDRPLLGMGLGSCRISFACLQREEERGADSGGRSLRPVLRRSVFVLLLIPTCRRLSSEGQLIDYRLPCLCVRRPTKPA